MLLWQFLFLLFLFFFASCAPSQPFGPWRELPDVFQDPEVTQSHGLAVLALPYESDTGVDIQKAGLYAVRLFLTSHSEAELEIHRKEILGLTGEKGLLPRTPQEAFAKIKESPVLTEAAKELALRELVDQITRSVGFSSVGVAGGGASGSAHTGAVPRIPQEVGRAPRSQEYYKSALEEAITAEFTNRALEEILKVAPQENSSRLLFFPDKVTEIRIQLRDARSEQGFEMRVQVSNRGKKG